MGKSNKKKEVIVIKHYFVICLTACTVWLASLLPCCGPAFAAEASNPHGKVDAAVVKKVEWEVRTLARKFSELGKVDKETVFALLVNYLWKNPQIQGAAVAFAPETRNGKEIKSCPYVYRSGDQLIEKDLSSNCDYTAPEQKWYAKAVKLGRPTWSEPYLAQSGGEGWMTTYSIPVYAGGKERQLIAVVTSDVLMPSEQ
jgi:hypothetical protein